MDARRPYNLSNVFGLQSTEGSELVPGVTRGEVSARYKSGVGGVFVFDDGDIEQELKKERGRVLCPGGDAGVGRRLGE